MLNLTEINVDGLATLPEPKSLGTRHHPLPHHRFVRVIEDGLKDHGVNVSGRHLELSHGGNRIFGTYRLAAPPHIQAVGNELPGTLNPMLGFKNSVDQEFGGRVAMAGEVFNCSNGMWLVERGFEVKRKNTLHVEAGLVELMRSMMKDYWATYLKTLDHHLDLAEDPLGDRDAHDLICRGVREGITPKRHAGNVLDAWHQSPYDWGRKSLWKLHNAHTYVMDRLVQNPYVRSKRNLALNAMISRHPRTSHYAGQARSRNTEVTA